MLPQPEDFIFFLILTDFQVHMVRNFLGGLAGLEKNPLKHEKPSFQGRYQGSKFKSFSNVLKREMRNLLRNDNISTKYNPNPLKPLGNDEFVTKPPSLKNQNYQIATTFLRPWLGLRLGLG